MKVNLMNEVNLIKYESYLHLNGPSIYLYVHPSIAEFDLLLYILINVTFLFLFNTHAMNNAAFFSAISPYT